ncbi:hypothetical protein C8R44DRAFT_731523 [Mycena epipterygia]|nr:hypothetical protein C8R44DRAFT_731523 [Mycena epipterygia]
MAPISPVVQTYSETTAVHQPPMIHQFFYVALILVGIGLLWAIVAGCSRISEWYSAKKMVDDVEVSIVSQWECIISHQQTLGSLRRRILQASRDRFASAYCDTRPPSHAGAAPRLPERRLRQPGQDVVQQRQRFLRLIQYTPLGPHILFIWSPGNSPRHLSSPHHRLSGRITSPGSALLFRCLSFVSSLSLSLRLRAQKRKLKTPKTTENAEKSLATARKLSKPQKHAQNHRTRFRMGGSGAWATNANCIRVIHNCRIWGLQSRIKRERPQKRAGLSRQRLQSRPIRYQVVLLNKDIYGRSSYENDHMKSYMIKKRYTKRKGIDGESACEETVAPQSAAKAPRPNTSPSPTAGTWRAFAPPAEGEADAEVEDVAEDATDLADDSADDAPAEMEDTAEESAADAEERAEEAEAAAEEAEADAEDKGAVAVAVPDLQRGRGARGATSGGGRGRRGRDGERGAACEDVTGVGRA